MPEKIRVSVCVSVCICKHETVRDFLCVGPFQIQSDFGFIIKIMYQLARPWE